MSNNNFEEAVLHQIAAWQCRDNLKLWAKGSDPAVTEVRAAGSHQYILDRWRDRGIIDIKAVQREANRRKNPK